jgi:hypothetical protein
MKTTRTLSEREERLRSAYLPRIIFPTLTQLTLARRPLMTPALPHETTCYLDNGAIWQRFCRTPWVNLIQDALSHLAFK